MTENLPSILVQEGEKGNDGVAAISTIQKTNKTKLPINELIKYKEENIIEDRSI